MARKTKLERFNDYVLSKFQIYNSLFLTLPFANIQNTSLFLPLLSDFCKRGYEENLSPSEIIESCFKYIKPDFDWEKKVNLLFGFVQ